MRATDPGLVRRADSMISKMRERAKSKNRSVPFGVKALRGWLVMASHGGTGQVWQCAYCERFLVMTEIEADHIEPVTRGGSFDLDNLAVACKRCNQTKGELSLESYRALMLGLDSFPLVDKSYILKCLRTQGIGQRLRFSPPDKKGLPAPASQEEQLQEMYRTAPRRSPKLRIAIRTRNPR